ncbi:sulfotransferase [Streptomyces sp. P1-3]|uniref:sulfotransferase n=1 Tax=Streptomyces sp. P1-3 TaxID=3421658 RepID=UPI003D36AEFE
MEIQRYVQAAVYGCHEFDAERLSRVYDEHLAAVRDHFHGRPGDLLELDIAGGKGWDELAPFLDSGAPADSFPRVGFQRQTADEKRELAPGHPGQRM